MVSEPWLWTGIGALFLGLALGEALLVFRTSGPGNRLAVRLGRPPRASLPRYASLCFVFLSLCGAAMAALLVLCGTELGEPLYQLYWSLYCLLLGLFLIVLPRSLGFPLLALSAAFCLLMSLGLAGSGLLAEPRRIASFLPLTTGAGYTNGEFSPDNAAGLPPLSGAEPAAERVPAAEPIQTLELKADRISLAVELLELRGPFRLWGARHYRILGFMDSSGAWLLNFGRHWTVFDIIAPVSAGAQNSFTAGLFRRYIEKSPAVAASPLERIDFSFAEIESGQGRTDSGALVLKAEAR